MEIGKALTFPFQDDDWASKLGIGVAVSLLAYFIPVIGTAPLAGWQVRLIRNVKQRNEMPLPAWEDFGGLFKDGIIVVIAQIIYQLPVILFFCVAWLIPVLTGAGATAAFQDPGQITDAMGPIVLIVFACCGCLAVIYSIVASLAFAGGLIRFADAPEFGTFVQIGENFGLVRENLSTFLMAALYIILGTLGIAIVGSIASVITLGLGSLVLAIVFTYFIGHILGQLGLQLGSGGDMPAAPAAEPAV